MRIVHIFQGLLGGLGSALVTLMPRTAQPESSRDVELLQQPSRHSATLINQGQVICSTRRVVLDVGFVFRLQSSFCNRWVT